MWRQDDALHAPVFLMTNEICASFGSFLTVVDAGHKMTMDICVKKECGRFLLTLFFEKIKHGINKLSFAPEPDRHRKRDKPCEVLKNCSSKTSKQK